MGKGNGGKTVEVYVGAPYNFVPFAKKPYALEPETQVPHNTFAEERMDGEIRYRITAKTPIFVSDGFEESNGKKNPDFARNQYGEYAIPGNTMRGLVRNNLQILSESGFAEDVDDYRMMFREVAGGKDRIDRKRYGKILGASLINVGKDKQVSILKHVKAGYITKENGKYYIFGTTGDTEDAAGQKINYYIVSERNIIDQYVDNNYSYDDFSFFFDNPGKYLQHKVTKKFKKQGKNYVNDENPEYIPYYEKVAYKVSSNGKVISVKALKDELDSGYEKGYVISSGPMKNKKVIYIIPDIDRTGKCIDIQDTDSDAIRAYQVDYEKRKNGLKPVKAKVNKDKKDREMQEFFDLPKEDQIKPVFYIEKGGLYFGFTPRLRLFNDFSIKHGMNAEQKQPVFDYAKSIFGYSNKKESYKSRVSFSDAVLTREGTQKREKAGVILAEPKPSSFADYLVQDGETIVNTYNSDKFELRGVKQYWLHDSIVSPEKSDKEKVMSTIYPLSEGSEFEGIVRFSNLNSEELGLLLWSIRLEENSLVNIGQAKSFGYGVSKIDLLSVKKYDWDKAYKIDGDFALDAFNNSELDAEQLINEYKQTLEKRLGTKIDDNPSIQAFLCMKDSTAIPDERLVKYMSVDAGNYRNRTALKDVSATITESREMKNKPLSGGSQSAAIQGQSNQGERRHSGGTSDRDRSRAGSDIQTKDGKIKFVNIEKGFGFIRVAGEEDDVYFRVEKFSSEEQGRINKGKKVEVSYRQGNRGLQAVNCRLL